MINRVSRLKLSLGVTSLTILILAACQTVDFGDNVLFVVPGEGIDGVRLGDSRATVVERLGKPDLGGIADGFYRAWYSAEYTQGQHAGLSVYFVEVDNQPGPVDELIIQAPHSGKTSKSIGIASPLNAVRRAYGLPESTIGDAGNGTMVDMYCVGGKKLEIHYRDSLVTGMAIGYFLPMPQDSMYPCK